VLQTATFQSDASAHADLYDIDMHVLYKQTTLTTSCKDDY